MGAYGAYRAREVHHCLGLVAELLVHLAEHKIDRPLLWRHLDELLELGERKLVLVRRQEHLRLIARKKKERDKLIQQVSVGALVFVLGAAISIGVLSIIIKTFS